MRRRLLQLPVLAGLFLTGAQAQAAVWYEDIQQASERCKQFEFERAVGDVKASGARYLVFRSILGWERDKAREALTKVALSKGMQDDLGSAGQTFFQCVAGNLSESPNPFDGHGFFALHLGSPKTAIQDLGVKVSSDRTSPVYGPYLMVDHLNVEPANTVARNLYYFEGQGLYRVLIDVGSPGGNTMKPDDAALRWEDFIKKFAKAGAKIFDAKPFESFDGRTLDDLRECPKGNDETRNVLRSLNDDELRAMIFKEMSTKAAQFLSISCGDMSLPSMQLAFDDWKGAKVQVTFGELTSGRALVRLIYVDTNIAKMAVREK